MSNMALTITGLCAMLGRPIALSGSALDSSPHEIRDASFLQKQHIQANMSG